MPFDLQGFVNLREFVYHVTDQANLRRLRTVRCLHPASELLSLASRDELIRQKRPEKVQIIIGRDTIVLKDQRPLRFANVEFAPGWRKEDFVAYLNGHVFFWAKHPGGSTGHASRFQNHYARDAILRIPTKKLIEANRSAEPLFCPYNAGAPRKQLGIRVARGPNLFQPADKFRRTACEVVEMAFRSSVNLPCRTELRTPLDDWKNLWHDTE
jgi:hypothetical protein